MIKINNEDIRIRPSAVNDFFSCSFKWGKYFLEGTKTFTNSRAAIGTAIHAAAEQMWNEAIASGKKEANLSAMTDAAMESWKESKAEGMKLDDGETDGTAAVEIVRGTEAFIEDIVPFSSIPTAVEQFYKVDIKHPLVAEIGGTIDYITDTCVGDIKTSKRKINAASYTTQQSIYTYLAKANGIKVETNLIQGIVLKKTGAEGSIQLLEANEEEAKARVNIILDTLDIIAKDVAPIETILRPNPGHYLCSPKYCALYPCHAIKEL